MLTIMPLVLLAQNSETEKTQNKFQQTNVQLEKPELVKLDQKKVVRDSIQVDSTKKEKLLFETTVQYSSDDSIRFSLTNQKVFLSNNAFVKYGNTELKAYYVELDLAKKEAFAYGIQDSTGNFIHTPEFKDGAEEFKCKKLRYNFDTGKGLVYEVITEQEGGFVHSEKTKRVDEKTFFLRNGKYTTCDHEHPHFYVKMTKAKMIKDEKIVAGPSYVVIEDVPLYFVGLPFAMFPFSSSYSSGIILPSYGEEKNRGFNLRGGGYYWAINDYMDLSLTGDIFTNGSWGTYVKTNYKKRYKFGGNLSGEYHKNKYGDKGLDDYRETTDFAVRWRHAQDPKANPYRTFSASVNFSTSNNDRNNSQSIQRITNNQKQSSISYSRKWADSPFSLNANLSHSQNSRDTSIALTLPNLSVTMDQIYPFRKKGKSSDLRWWDNIGVRYSSSMTNTINTKESKLMSSSLRKDWNNGYKHDIPISTKFKLTRDLTLSPNISYKGVLYTRSIHKKWDPSFNNGVGKTPGKVINDTIQKFTYVHNYSTSLSLSINPKIYGMYTFKETSKLAFLRHVMTPGISVSYTPKVGVNNDKYYNKTYKIGEKEYSYSIFEGAPYGGVGSASREAGSINLSLDNNVEAKFRTANDTTGNEEFKKVKILESLRFSTSYDMFADSLNWSPLNISGRTNIFNKRVNLRFGSRIDPYKLDAKNNRIDQFGPRLTNASFDVSFRLSSDDFKEKENKGAKKKWRDPRYVKFSLPWSFSLDYGWTYSKPTDKSTVNQNLGLTGNFSLTPNWLVNFSTGYDFDAKKITATQFAITRKLHCWVMSFNAIPFGTYQSYNFRINVKSSILQELKYEKRQAWQDIQF